VLFTAGFSYGREPSLVFERSSTSEPFQTGAPIPGLGDVPYMTPDPSADGLWLVLGARWSEVWLAGRARVGDPFGEPELVVASSDAATQWFSATISEDCRSVYAVRAVEETTGQQRRTLEVFSR
jgi:hypothetical protein